MINVFAHVVQVVVFPSCSNAFLRVGGPPQLGHGVGRVDGVQEDGLELKTGSATDAAKTLTAGGRRSVCVEGNGTWFMPALANSSVGSSSGTVDEECTYWCSNRMKKSINF